MIFILHVSRGGLCMKKLIFVILCLCCLVGCKAKPTESDDTLDEYIRPRNYIGYANHISITETVMPENQRLPQKYFSGTYSNIKYTALTKELCVTANVNDIDYKNAKYYLVGRKEGTSYLGEIRIQFLAPEGFGSKTACFDHVDLSEAYEVLLTKYDSDDLNPSNTMYSVRTLRLIDLKAQQRNYIINTNIFGHTPIAYVPTEDPYLLFSTSYSDVGRTIHTVHIVLFDPFNDHIIESRQMTITQEDYEGDTLSLRYLRFDNLAPNLEYSIQIFADGNDGVDEFERITIGNYSYKTGTYEISAVNRSFHGLYAAVSSMSVIDDQVYIYFKYKNDQTMIYADTKEELSLVITVRTGNYQNRVEETFPFDASKQYIVLPKAVLNDGLSLSIRDSRFKYNFCDFGINPFYMDLYTQPIDDHAIKLEIVDKGNGLPLSMKIDIIDNNNNVLETLDNLSMAFGYNIYPYLGTYDKTLGYRVVITYQVNSMIGVLTHTEILPLR